MPASASSRQGQQQAISLEGMKHLLDIRDCEIQFIVLEAATASGSGGKTDGLHQNLQFGQAFGSGAESGAHVG